MPNTLGHFGVQGLVSRKAFPGIDVRWVLLGCVLPDVAWIIYRMTRTLALAGMEGFELFWPESWISHLLTLTGVGFIAWSWRRGLWAPLPLAWRRWPIALLLFAVYLARIIHEARFLAGPDRRRVSGTAPDGAVAMHRSP